MKTVKKDDKDTEEKYTKKQIINSKTFADNKDLLNAILEEGKVYSKKNIDETIKKYKEGLVI